MKQVYPHLEHNKSHIYIYIPLLAKPCDLWGLSFLTRN